MENIVKIKKKEIKKFIGLGDPFIFIDEVEAIPGISAKGLRYFSKNEWFFEHHFINDPVVPGVFQMEHIMQTAAIAVLVQEIPDTNIIYGKNFSDMNLISFVRPGETLHCDTKIKYFKRGLGEAEGYAWVERNGKKIITSTAKFQMVSPTLLNKFIPGAKKNVQE